MGSCRPGWRQSTITSASVWPTASFANKENNVKKLTAICFALALLTFGVASAQDNMKNHTMKDDASKKAVQVTGKVSDDGNVRTE